MRKRLLLSLLTFFLASITMLGGEITIDGIKYHYSYTISSTHLNAEVSVVDGKSKEGVVEIPSSIVVDDDVKLFVTKIGQYAFDGNTKITKVTIPGCTAVIDGGAFRDCSSLETVVIETGTSYNDVFKGLDFDFNGLTYIMGHAFSGCTNLKSINLPETLTTIGENAFYRCTSLTNIDLPSSLKALGSLSGPFTECTSLKSITIPESVSTICYRAFMGCTSLESVTFMGAINLIGEGAFWKCNSLKAIDLSKGVKEISSIAFQESGIESVILPKIGLEKIGSSCFASTKLKSLYVPAGVTSIGDTFCGNCTELTEVVIGGANSAGASLFTGCSNLTSANITWTGELPAYLFKECTSLASVTLSGNITAIGIGTFYGCTGLQSMTLPNTVTSIGYYAFQGCSALESIALPNVATAIKNSAFKDCSKLTSLTLPESLQIVENDVFSGCSSLTSLTFPTSMTTLGSEDVFRYCNSMELLDFRACTNLPRADESRTRGTFRNLPETTVILWPGDEEQISGKEPYAVLSDDNQTLTFYYDTTKKERNGMGIGPFKFKNGVDSGWYRMRNSIGTVVFDESFADYHELTSTAFWFYQFFRLTTITGIENLNTENVTDMTSMFYNCPCLEKLDLSHFNTENVIYMGTMFSACTNLTSLDVSHFNTSKVKDMWGMFETCMELKSLDLHNFNTEKVEKMGNMFSGCWALTDIDLSNFNTESVIRMDGMFANCKALTSIDLSNFCTKGGDMETSMWTSMSRMFSGCLSLKEIYLGNHTGKMAMSGLFEGCTSLTTIYAGKGWKPDDGTYGNDVFKDCSSLVGGKGTVYDAEHTDYTYAHVDGGNNNPGYFTLIGDADEETVPIDTDDDLDEQNYFRGDCKPKDDNSIEIVIVLKAVGDVEIPSSISVDGEEISVTSIGANAFANSTEMTSVAIPSTITNIGEGAFAGCSALNAIYCFAPDPIALGSAEAKVRTRADGEDNSAATVFAEVNKETCILYVPKNSSEKYHQAAGWGEFQNIVEMDSEIKGDANNDGKVDNEDINSIVEYILRGNTEYFIFKNADANGDKKVNVADIVIILNKKE